MVRAAHGGGRYRAATTEIALAPNQQHPKGIHYLGPRLWAVWEQYAPVDFSVMNPFMRMSVGVMSVPVLGSLRYAVAMALLCWIWVHDAHLLNRAFDMNLACVKYVAGLTDGSGRVEAALRGFSADRMLLFTEAGILVWLAGKILWWPFGLLLARQRQRGTETQQPKITPRPTVVRPGMTRPSTPRPTPDVAARERR